MSNENIIVAITGASGVIYAQKLLQMLNSCDINVHLIMSDAAIVVIEHELGIKLNDKDLDIAPFLECKADNITTYRNNNQNSPVISGGFKSRGMIIVPCSMNTLCSIGNGLASNIICRTASVILKERRELVMVPRETPLTSIHLENMLKLSNAGACILPAMPGFYHNPKTIDDQINFIVAKILDYFQIEHSINIRYNW